MIGVILVNCCIHYIVYLESKDIKKKNMWSQYEFRKVISLTWIDPNNYWKINDKKDPMMKLIIIKLLIPDKRKHKTKKFTCVSDYFFNPNSNIAHRMSRYVEHELKYFSPHSKWVVDLWAADRKVQSMAMLPFVLIATFVSALFAINCLEKARMH